MAGPGSLISSASLYGRAAVRLLQRRRRVPAEERLVFVVGCPRSGTTFMAGALGSQPGFVDLGEVHPLKGAIPTLAGLPESEAAPQVRRVLERVRRLGLAHQLRGVEQTPETAFVLPAALAAYPAATAVHVVRDGRDVVCSLLERGWLSSGRTGADDARLAYGSQARFWVEPDRIEEFEAASDARRAAWAWRRYVTAARALPDRTLAVRYEEVVASPEDVAYGLANGLRIDPEPLADALAQAHARSVGRWREDLTAEQVADVEAEAGELLHELGYAIAG